MGPISLRCDQSVNIPRGSNGCFGCGQCQRQSGGFYRRKIVPVIRGRIRIEHYGYMHNLRRNRFQQLDPYSSERIFKSRQPAGSSSGPGKTCDETGPDRISYIRKDNGKRLSLFQKKSGRWARDSCRGVIAIGRLLSPFAYARDNNASHGPRGPGSLHPSETSAFNKIRALSSRRAGLFPFRINDSNRSRTSPFSRTTYLFTDFSRVA
jgi:hypothetical protein